jgi:hypothetical protein
VRPVVRSIAVRRDLAPGPGAGASAFAIYGPISRAEHATPPVQERHPESDDVPLAFRSVVTQGARELMRLTQRGSHDPDRGGPSGWAGLSRVLCRTLYSSRKAFGRRRAVEKLQGATQTGDIITVVCDEARSDPWDQPGGGIDEASGSCDRAEASSDRARVRRVLRLSCTGPSSAYA